MQVKECKNKLTKSREDNKAIAQNLLMQVLLEKEAEKKREEAVKYDPLTEKAMQRKAW